MFRRMKSSALVVLTVLMVAALSQAQTQSHKMLSIQGHAGQANVIQWQGRTLVDVQDLAEITKGSLSFDKNGILLTLSTCDDAEHEATKAGFSREFTKAAIEAMASIREWGGISRARRNNARS